MDGQADDLERGRALGNVGIPTVSSVAGRDLNQERSHDNYASDRWLVSEPGESHG